MVSPPADVGRFQRQKKKGPRGQEYADGGTCQGVTEVKPMKNSYVIINVMCKAAFGAGTVQG